MMEQLSLFNEPPLKIHNKVRLIELFSGIGAQAKAMERLGVDFEHWRAYDFDRFAVASYNAVHGTNFGIGDVTKIHAADLGIENREEFTYLLTYSFPCQDLSISGKRKGMSKGSGTRSGLLWEVERLLKECNGNLPQILLMENVKQVINHKNKPDFDFWRESLTEMGYTSAYQVMNAKDYGVAQNRERCFMVSWLGDYTYEFPKPIPLVKRLRDYLEDDDKAVLNDSYVSEKGVKFILDPKRGMLTDINPDVAIPLTRVGQRNWTGSFISPDIDHIEKSSTIGSKVPIDIYLKNGGKITSDDDTSNLRIRKLTPLECWRLMNFDDEDFYKAQAIESNTQLYAQAGNSIVVNCLTAIFGQMFEGKEDVYKDK